MNIVPSIINKYIKFPFEDEIHAFYHSGFKPLAFHGNFSLDYFLRQPIEPIKPHEDHFLYHIKILKPSM